MVEGRPHVAAVSARLSAMMFLQFFIWGAWYVTAPIFLGDIGFTAGDFGWTYSVGPIAGMLSPLFVGMIADRFFSTERVLGVLHLAGAGIMYGAIQMMQAAAPNPNTINLMFFFYMLCYFPTLALTNSLALQNITDSEKQFPLIRVFGTIGWIVAGLLLSWQGWDTKEFGLAMFQLTAVASAVMGVYCFTLPHTPPPLAGKKATVGEVLGFDALVMLKRPAFLIFIICSFLVCIPLAFYYQIASRFVDAAGLENPAFKMTFGQMSEIFFMLVMPLFFVRLGVKWMLFVGMLAWVVRYALFSFAAADGVAWMILTGVILHGICYDFFFVTGQIYTDKAAPQQIRSQAQGLLVLFTLGLGMLIGAQIAGKVEGHYTASSAEKAATRAKAIDAEIQTVRESVSQKTLEPAEADTQIAALRAERKTLLLGSKDWKMIWGIPAIGAAAILLLFTLLFRDDTRKRNGVTDAEVAAAASREEMM